jgi:predicted Zn-dependent peptidase
MTIGSMEDLDRATVADVQAFYDKYYVPNNAVLVIVGDFSTADAESLVRQNFAHLSNGPEAVARADPGIPPEPPQTRKRVIKLEKDVALPAFIEGYHMPADGTPDAYPLRIAAKILSQGESSRIYRRLVYDKQVAVQAETEGNFTEDPNLFFVMVVLNPGYTLSQGQVEVAAELDRLKTERVTQQELEKAKNQVLRDFVVSRQSDQTRAEELGYAAVVLKDPNLLDAELDRFQAVTPDDIQRVATKYFVPENVTIVEVTPKVGAGK